MERRPLSILGAPDGLMYFVVGQQGEGGVMDADAKNGAVVNPFAGVGGAEVVSSIPSWVELSPEKQARAMAAAGLDEERSVIEAFLEDGGLTEREENLARLWLRWDDVTHGMAWPGQGRVAVTAERARDLRSRAYAELATSYSQAVGRPGSKVRSGAPGARRPGGLVLTAKSVREREEDFDEVSVGPEAPVLTLEDVEEQVERSFDTGGVLGVGDLMAWLKEFVQMRGDEIEAEQREVDRKGRGCVEQMAYLRGRQDVLEGRRIVVGALVRAIEERDR